MFRSHTRFTLWLGRFYQELFSCFFYPYASSCPAVGSTTREVSGIVGVPATAQIMWMGFTRTQGSWISSRRGPTASCHQHTTSLNLQLMRRTITFCTMSARIGPLRSVPGHHLGTTSQALSISWGTTLNCPWLVVDRYNYHTPALQPWRVKEGTQEWLR